MSNPWTIATPGETQDTEPLCKHVCDTLDIDDDVEVVGCTEYYPMGLTGPGEIQHVQIWLKRTTPFSYIIKIQSSETGERVLKAKTVLAQLIMKDPLLLNGVTEFDYDLNANDWSGHLLFHGHRVDISPFFDGAILQTSSIVNEIIRKVSASSGHQHVCSIGMVPIMGNKAFLECESTQTFQDKKTGNPYYYNIETGESTWEKPRINKSGEGKSSEGKSGEGKSGEGKSWAEPSLMLKRLGSRRQVSVCYCCFDFSGVLFHLESHFFFSSSFILLCSSI